MQPGAQLGRFEAPGSLPQEGGDEPGEHISTAGGRHAGVAGQVDIEAVAIMNDGPVSLEQDGAAAPGGEHQMTLVFFWKS